MDDIAEFLKKHDGTRLTLDNSWLFWNDWGRDGEWVVCTHNRYAKKVTVMERTDDLALALRALGNEE